MKNIKFKAYHPKWGYIHNPSIRFENNQWSVDFDVAYANGCFNEESGGKLLRSTGLFDKNNKEIYEGDILFGETRNDPKIPTFTGIVEFHGPTASFLIRSEDGFTRGLNSLYNPVIVGNIYEPNPIQVGAKVMIMGGDPKIRGEIGVVSCFKEWDLNYCCVKIEDKMYEAHYKDLMSVS